MERYYTIKMAFLVCVLSSIILTVTATTFKVDENLTNIGLGNITYTLAAGELCRVTGIYLVGNNLYSSWFNVSQVDYDATTEQYYSLLTLIRALDYEETPFVNIRSSTKVECPGIEDQTQIQSLTIWVNNLLDSKPYFNQSQYTVEVAENQQVPTVVVAGIFAIEEDITDQVTYTVQFSESQQKQFKHTIALQMIDGVPRTVVNIILVAPLDYETRIQHQFTVTVMDTVNMTSSCVIIINVVDVQDTPPTFSLPSYSGRVVETSPEGTVILFVSAWDGDLSASRNTIAYSILEEGANKLFEIDNTTGAITVLADLDVDDNGSNGIENQQILMTIQASELDSNGTRQVGNTTNTTVQVQILVLDSNDNIPEFNAASYSGSIREDSKENTMINMDGGGFITVFDKDQLPSNNGFTLHVERNGIIWPAFEPVDKTVFSQTSILLILKQPKALDGMESTHIKFQIVATETKVGVGGTNNVTSTSADLLLWVLPPIAASEAVVDIPLRTSDFIIFVIGFLILFNMIITVLLCLLFRRQNKPAGGFFNRHNSYYVSERDKSITKKHASSLSKLQGDDDDDDKVDESKPVRVTVKPENALMFSPNTNIADTGQSRIAVIDEHTPITNTVASALNRSRCDVIPIEIESQYENTNIPNSSTTSASASATKNKSRCDVFPIDENTILKTPIEPKGDKKDNAKGDKNVKAKGDNKDNERSRGDDVMKRNDTNRMNGLHEAVKDASRCDVTPLKSFPLNVNSTTEKVKDEKNEEKGQSSRQCDVIPHEPKTSLSNILQRVHQKLSSVSKYGSNPDPRASDFDLRPITENSNNASLESSFTDISNSNNSSFSSKAQYDVAPLIHTSGGERKEVNKINSASVRSNADDVMRTTGHVNNAYSDDVANTSIGKITPKKNPAGSKTISENTTTPDTGTNSYDDDSFPNNCKDKIANRKPAPIPSTTSAVKDSNPSSSSSRSRSIRPPPPLPASQRQITQTGVPPIALALPFATAVVPKEQPAKVTNPVFSEDPSSSATRKIKVVTNPKEVASIWSDGQHALTASHKSDTKQETGQNANTPKLEMTSQNVKAPKAVMMSHNAKPIDDHQLQANTSNVYVNVSNGPIAAPILRQTSQEQVTKSEPSLNDVKVKAVAPNLDYIIAAKKLLRSTSTASAKDTASTENLSTPHSQGETPVKPARKISFKSDDDKTPPSAKFTQF